MGATRGYCKFHLGGRARNKKRKIDREHINNGVGEVEARAIAKAVKIVVRPEDRDTSPHRLYRRSGLVEAGKGIEVDRASLPPG